MNIADLSISGKDLEDILSRYGVTEAYVFGSFARGDATPESDLDLLVTYRQGTTLFDVANLQEALEKALNRRVDLVSRKNLSKRLTSRIEHDLKPLSSIL